VISEWKSEEFATAWNRAVGEAGDVFQQLIIKPYLAAALAARETPDGGETATAFYRLLASAAGLTEVDQIVAKVSQVLVPAESDREPLQVLDLGGGEGFVGRWLSPLCEGYTVIDVSQPLLRAGERKSAEHPRVRFIYGDLEDLGSAESLDHWLACCSTDEKASATSKGEPDLVLCLNVLDHLASPLPALTKLAKALSVRAKAAEMIVSTLNPQFFLSSANDVDRETGWTRVKMGPAGQTVEIVPRSWMAIEALFADAGFSVVSCDPIHISQYPRSVQKALIDAADLDAQPSHGPFILWRLSAIPAGQLLAWSDVKDLSLKSRVLTVLCKAVQHLAEDERPQIRRIHYDAGIPIARKSNLPPGLFVVASGEAEVRARGEVRQVFKQGEVFAELELGGDPFVGRFLYPVLAGPNGCDVLLIDKEAVERLMALPAQDTLARILYDILRERTSTYSFVYHRSTPTTRVTSARAGKRKGKRTRAAVDQPFNVRECETLARALLFAATMEGGKLQEHRGGSSGNDGLSVLILPEAMRRAVADEPVHSAKKEEGGASSGTPLRDMAKLFHALALVDAFDVATHRESTDETRRVCDQTFQRLIGVATTTLLLPRLRELVADPERLMLDVKKSFDQFDASRPPDWPHTSVAWSSLVESRLVETLSESVLELDAEARDFVTSLSEQIVRRYAVPLQEVRRAANRLVLNLAFVQLEFFKRKTPRFFVINDMYAVRRFATGSTGWADEFIARASASPYVRRGSNGEFSVPARAADSADEWRFVAYVKRFETYTTRLWRAGLDLRHTHDTFFDEPSLIEKAFEGLDN
jgi:SAM-dependent methyltransferase